MNVCTWWKRTCERQRGVRVFDLTAEVLRHVAVGTRVTSRPRTNPYMRLSLIRLLPRVRTHHQIHDDTHAAIACDMLNPAQCPEHALMARIPLGLGPSLHQLRSRSLCLVRRLHSYYGLVRLPTPVHHRLRLLAFPMRTAVRESELSTDGQTWDIPGSDAIHLRVMCS